LIGSEYRYNAAVMLP